MQARHRFAGAALAVAALATFLQAQAPRPAACPEHPQPTLSPEVPSDVCIPDGFTDVALEYFDDFSWRTFVALAWPAMPGQRGVAAATRPLSTPGPRVFDTYKALPELFHRDGSAPEAAFNRYEAAANNPCLSTSGFGEITIGSASGIDDIGQSGSGVLEGPLVAQNGRYVRTWTSFNRPAFDHVVQNRYFLRSALPVVPRPRPDTPVIDFPMGSIVIKAAWIDVTDLPAAIVKRMYTRTAMLKSPTGSGCARTTVGLIGLHIAHKTPSRPQWIWSSFEQKDAVPPTWPDSPGSFLLHDGTREPMPSTNPLSLTPLTPEPARPFNVLRDANSPILTPTELTSFAYQRALAGTPWQYYRLVVSQWPRREGDQATPIPATQDGSVPNTFPGPGSFSASANVTMETFSQQGAPQGCMNCHNRTRLATDFMWTLQDHAYPAQLTAATATH